MTRDDSRERGGWREVVPLPRARADSWRPGGDGPLPSADCYRPYRTDKNQRSSSPTGMAHAGSKRPARPSISPPPNEKRPRTGESSPNVTSGFNGFSIPSAPAAMRRNSDGRTEALKRPEVPRLDTQGARDAREPSSARTPLMQTSRSMSSGVPKSAYDAPGGREARPIPARASSMSTPRSTTTAPEPKIQSPRDGRTPRSTTAAPEPAPNIQSPRDGRTPSSARPFRGSSRTSTSASEPAPIAQSRRDGTPSSARTPTSAVRLNTTIPPDNTSRASSPMSISPGRTPEVEQLQKTKKHECPKTLEYTHAVARLGCLKAWRDAADQRLRAEKAHTASMIRIIAGDKELRTQRQKAEAEAQKKVDERAEEEAKCVAEIEALLPAVGSEIAAAGHPIAVAPAAAPAPAPASGAEMSEILARLAALENKTQVLEQEKKAADRENETLRKDAEEQAKTTRAKINAAVAAEAEASRRFLEKSMDEALTKKADEQAKINQAAIKAAVFAETEAARKNWEKVMDDALEKSADEQVEINQAAIKATVFAKTDAVRKTFENTMAESLQTQAKQEAAERAELRRELKAELRKSESIPDGEVRLKRLEDDRCNRLNPNNMAASGLTPVAETRLRNLETSQKKSHAMDRAITSLESQVKVFHDLNRQFDRQLDEVDLRTRAERRENEDVASELRIRMDAVEAQAADFDSRLSQQKDSINILPKLERRLSAIEEHIDDEVKVLRERIEENVSKVTEVLDDQEKKNAVCDDTVAGQAREIEVLGSCVSELAALKHELVANFDERFGTLATKIADITNRLTQSESPQQKDDASKASLSTGQEPSKDTPHSNIDLQGLKRELLSQVEETATMASKRICDAQRAKAKTDYRRMEGVVTAVQDGFKKLKEELAISSRTTPAADGTVNHSCSRLSVVEVQGLINNVFKTRQEEMKEMQVKSHEELQACFEEKLETMQAHLKDSILETKQPVEEWVQNGEKSVRGLEERLRQVEDLVHNGEEVIGTVKERLRQIEVQSVNEVSSAIEAVEGRFTDLRKSVMDSLQGAEKAYQGLEERIGNITTRQNETKTHVSNLIGPISEQLNNDRNHRKHLADEVRTLQLTVVPAIEASNRLTNLPREFTRLEGTQRAQAIAIEQFTLRYQNLTSEDMVRKMLAQMSQMSPSHQPCMEEIEASRTAEKKLGLGIQRLEKEMSELNGDNVVLKGNVNTLMTDADSLKTDADSLKTDAENLKIEFKALSDEVNEVFDITDQTHKKHAASIEALEQDVSDMRAKVADLPEDTASWVDDIAGLMESIPGDMGEMQAVLSALAKLVETGPTSVVPPEWG